MTTTPGKIDLQAVNRALPRSTREILYHGSDAVLERGCGLVNGFYSSTFKVVLESEFGFCQPIIGGWNAKNEGKYAWTDLYGGIHEGRPGRQGSGSAENTAIVVFWKPREQLIELPAKCPARETVDALARWSVIERAKPHLIELLCEQEANEKSRARAAEAARTNGPMDEHFDEESDDFDEEVDTYEDSDEEYSDWGSCKPSQATQAFMANFKTRFVDIQGADSIYPADISADERAQIFNKLNESIKRRLEESEAELLERLARKLSTDDFEEQMTKEVPACHKNQVQEIRQDILDTKKEMKLLQDGKLHIQPLDALFETFSDEDIVRVFKETILSRGDCSLCPSMDIEFRKVGPNEENPHGCFYKLDYGPPYC